MPQKLRQSASVEIKQAGGLNFMANKSVEELLGRSNRLGSNPKFTNYAGGNTSAKGES